MLSSLISIFLASLTPAVQACAIHIESRSLQTPGAIQAEYVAQTQANLARRSFHNAKHRPHRKTVVTNVTIFDGERFSGPANVVIENGRIGSCEDNAHETIDGTGQTILPGLIDSHFHPDNISHLQATTRAGVTSGVVMACPSPELCASLEGHTGLTSVILGSCPGAAVDSIHGRVLGLNSFTALGNASTANQWIENQISAKAQLIKLVAETPGLDQATLSAATKAAHDKQRAVACHAADYISVQQAITASVDQIHHVPMDRPLDQSIIAQFQQQQTISVPTLIMMRKTTETIKALNFTASLASVKALHANKIKILAGTDANAQAMAPGHPAFGSSMYDELELLVQVGLSPTDALQSATLHAAQVWGLFDKGSIAIGKVADLVLVSGELAKNISAIRNIEKVWVGGHLFGE